MRIAHESGRCASTGLCESLAPDVFEIGADGALRVIDPAAVDDRVREAVEACPTAALRLAP